MRGLLALVSVGTKLMLPIFLVLAALTTLVYVGLSRFEKDKLIAAKEQGARMAGELFLRSASAPVIFDDETAIKDTAALLAQDPEVIGVQLWRVGRDQQVGAPLATQLKGAAEQGVAPRPAHTASMERRADRIILRDVVRDRDRKAIAVVAVQYSLARENLAFMDLRRRILLLAAGASALLALLLWAATRRVITGPLSRLLQAVRQVEAGERVDLNSVRSQDEVGRLAQAFARMAEAVDRRERELLRRNADMKLIMDHVAQGLLSVERSGALLPEHSAIVETWLGPWPSGGTFADYLQAQAPQAAEWLQLLWENVNDDFFPLEVALGQLPRRIEVGARVFDVLYTPIQRGPSADSIAGATESLRTGPDGGTVNILIMLSDVTSEVAQERAKRGEQEMINIFQWTVKDRAGLTEFFADGERRVRELSALGSETAVTGEALVQLKREIHTLKGNSAIFGLSSVVVACQAAEERLAEGATAVPPAELAALRGAWQGVQERRRQLLGDEQRTTIELEAAEQQALLAALLAAGAPAELCAQVRSFAREPLRRRLARIGEQARQLARRLGKGEITVQVEAEGLRLQGQGLREFWGSFAHLVSNAVDHGLETPEDREARGKSGAGTLRLRAAISGERFLVEIADDGRGIDWERLRHKAREAGLPHETRADLEAALFTDGLSTRAAVTETSGRGVGMSAVRGACEGSGGLVRVHSEPGAGTRFQFDWPVTVLREDVAE